jgi:hypothetical protein
MCALIGGHDAKPPISYMGAKTGYRRAIFDVLGLRAGQGADEILLVEPGPWANVWAILAMPGGPAQVAEVIRGWQEEGTKEPRKLFDRLKAEGWDLETVDGVGRWLMFVQWAIDKTGRQSTGFSVTDGCGKISGSFGDISPITPEKLASRVQSVAQWLQVMTWCVAKNGGSIGYSRVNGEGNPFTDRHGEQGFWEPDTPEKLAKRVEGVARWLLCANWAYRNGCPESGYNKTAAEGGKPGQNGNWSTLNPQTPAMLADKIGSSTLKYPTMSIYQGSAMDIHPPSDSSDWTAYIDPPYQNTSGYAHKFPREQVIEVALRWHNAGATVCISEAEPIQIPGWHHVQIDHARRGSKRTFSKQKDEWLTLNKPPVSVPGKQLTMFGG